MDLLSILAGKDSAFPPSSRASARLTAIFQAISPSRACRAAHWSGTSRKNGCGTFPCWTESTPDGKFPRMTYARDLNTKNSSFWMADASYLRLKNLQLNYRLPKKVTDKIRMSSVMLFANATNLFTLTDYYQFFIISLFII